MALIAALVSLYRGRDTRRSAGSVSAYERQACA
jgi:hypothetical protein